MYYSVAFSGRVTLPADTKHEATKKIEMIINQALNFDPSVSCSAHVLHPEEGEDDGD